MKKSRMDVNKGFSDLDGALWVLKNHPGLRNLEDMVHAATENGYSVTDRKGYRIILSLKEWGLVHHKQRRLTSRGEDFYSLWQRNRNIAIDVLHGLQYGLWSQYIPTQHLASWTYQYICDYLWTHQSLPRANDCVSSLYDSLEDLGESQVNIANSSVDHRTVTNTYDWLLSLSPPVLEGVIDQANGKSFRNATFNQRAFCSPALFLMGLSWVAREAGNEFGELVAVDQERKEQVCRFCLIERIRFDFMLTETVRRFSYVSAQQSDYIVIGREPQISDF